MISLNSTPLKIAKPITQTDLDKLRHARELYQHYVIDGKSCPNNHMTAQKAKEHLLNTVDEVLSQ